MTVWNFFTPNDFHIWRIWWSIIISTILNLRGIRFITSTTHYFLLFYIWLKIIQQNAKMVNLEMFVCWHKILNSVCRRHKGVSYNIGNLNGIKTKFNKYQVLINMTYSLHCESFFDNIIFQFFTLQFSSKFKAFYIFIYQAVKNIMN